MLDDGSVYIGEQAYLFIVSSDAYLWDPHRARTARKTLANAEGSVCCMTRKFSSKFFKNIIWAFSKTWSQCFVISCQHNHARTNYYSWKLTAFVQAFFPEHEPVFFNACNRFQCTADILYCDGSCSGNTSLWTAVLLWTVLADCLKTFSSTWTALWCGPTVQINTITASTIA